jgi:hypothetical protein
MFIHFPCLVLTVGDNFASIPEQKQFVPSFLLVLGRRALGHQRTKEIEATVPVGMEASIFLNGQQRRAIPMMVGGTAKVN